MRLQIARNTRKPPVARHSSRPSPAKTVRSLGRFKRWNAVTMPSNNSSVTTNEKSNFQNCFTGALANLSRPNNQIRNILLFEIVCYLNFRYSREVCNVVISSEMRAESARSWAGARFLGGVLNAGFEALACRMVVVRRRGRGVEAGPL